MIPAILPAIRVLGLASAGAAGSGSAGVAGSAGAGGAAAGGAGGVAFAGGGVGISIGKVEADLLANVFCSRFSRGRSSDRGRGNVINGRGNRRGGSQWRQEVREHVQSRLQHGGISAAPSAPVALFFP
jgi:hypothetical protein